MADELAERVNHFVEWLFRDYQRVVPRDAKVINDALLGNQYFSQHEIAVIDSPLLQRLKRIKQTGLVYQVFPSATHTRFEHCLGAATLAERCFNAIRDRLAFESPRTPFPADEDRLNGDLAHLRMAALLHDVGHGLCSHASEQIYEALTDIQEFKRNPQYAKNAPGEILSYLIVTSKVFRGWFDDVVNGACRADIDLDIVGQIILGRHPERGKFFLSQIVSSPYDADKLDYIARDSYYCGLALTVDLPRFYSMIATTEKYDHRILVLRSYVPLEQILFSKMILFGAVYHHAKVKCLDAMLRSLVQHIIQNPDQCAVNLKGKKIAFSEPVEFLYPTDDDFFSITNNFGDEFVKKMLSRLMRRDLFVRCIEISRRTVENWDDYHRKRLIELASNPWQLRELEQKIHQQLPGEIRGQVNSGEILLSVPGVPKIKSDFAFIQTSPTGDPETVEDFFPLEQSVEAYAHNKWKSFVYAPREYASAVSKAASEVIATEIGVKVVIAKSNEACHL
jgi:HD superfamily phosphohydrolase